MNARTRAQGAVQPIPRIATRVCFAAAAALSASIAASTTMAAAPDAHGAGPEVAVNAVDHSPWDALLQRYVRAGDDSVNRVDYAAVDAADRDALERYLRALQATPVAALDRGAQMAFWINLYNAYTVKLVLDHYPVASIREVPAGRGPSLAALFRFDTWASMFLGGPWATPIVRVEGRRLSLNDIEHRILRPGWSDPRIHYAVNCASMSCPNLSPVAYTSENLDALLERGARDYVNHPRGATAEGDRLHLSSIFRWYREDFGGTDEAILAHLRAYADSGLAAALDGVQAIEWLDYDWSLSDLPDKQTKP